MLPVIEREVVNKRNWVDEAGWDELVSIAGTAPGGVGVNAAAAIGYRKAGIAGMVAAVVGVSLPTFLIVLALSLLSRFYEGNPKVEAALKGMHGAIVALILMAGWRMARTSVYDTATAIVCAAAVAALLFTGIGTLQVILLGLLAGIVLVRGQERLGLSVRLDKYSAERSKPEAEELEYYI
jgi:chromate transporter